MGGQGDPGGISSFAFCRGLLNCIDNEGVVYGYVSRGGFTVVCRQPGGRNCAQRNSAWRTWRLTAAAVLW